MAFLVTTRNGILNDKQYTVPYQLSEKNIPFSFCPLLIKMKKQGSTKFFQELITQVRKNEYQITLEALIKTEFMNILSSTQLLQSL